MNYRQVVESVAQRTDSKIVFLVLDGVGGLPHPSDGKTALEAAKTPNLDRLAPKASMGLAYPVGRGITPGSGPGHLGIFGYSPTEYVIGRGVLEALGIGMELLPGDIAARANFCTVDTDGNVADRRAGRIPTKKNKELCARLSCAISEIDGVEVIIRPGKEHRFVVVFRGEGLADGLTETDPQKTAVPPVPVKATRAEAERTAAVANKFVDAVREELSGESPANMCLMRGLASKPDIPSLSDRFKLRPTAIATYPMYRGLAQLVGMDIQPAAETNVEEFEILRRVYNDFDFFFVHIKKTDSYGEDGNRDKKVSVIEEVDSLVPIVEELGPEVFAVTCDHSTPATMKAHSWHPVPFMLLAENAFADGLERFTERHCARGTLGHFPALEGMPVILACAGKLAKFGA